MTLLTERHKSTLAHAKNVPYANGMKVCKCEAGFTLAELLLTGVVLTLFVVGASFLLHPKDFGPESRNGQRWAGVAQIARGLQAYTRDNGALPDDIPTKGQIITSEQEGYDLCSKLVPKYLPDLPYDPQVGLTITTTHCYDAGAVYVSGYSIVKDKNGVVTIGAPAAEQQEKIALTVAFP